ncbi:hypothetical protein ACWCWQ_23385 [Streptomyces sp. NPDC001571]
MPATRDSTAVRRFQQAPPLGEVAAADLLPGIREHNVTHAPR